MGTITMTKNDDENQRDEENLASGAPLDEELTAAATEGQDDTETTADDSLGETAPNTDEADDISSAEAEDDTGDPAESGKDWLVDTGLAAAINPQAMSRTHQRTVTQMLPTRKRLRRTCMTTMRRRRRRRGRWLGRG